MSMICEIFEQYKLARISRIGNGRTDKITTVYLFVCKTCSNTINSETEFAVTDTTYSG